MSYFRRQLAYELMEMIVPLREHYRGTLISNSLHNILAYHARSAFVGDKLIGEFAKLARAGQD